MGTNRLLSGLLLLLTAAVAGPGRVNFRADLPTNSDAMTKRRVNEAYWRLPLHFEANQGQTDPQVKFLARGTRHTLFLTSTEAILVRIGQEPAPTGNPDTREQATGTVLRMTVLGANPQPRVAGREELPGKANYFIGNDPARWQTNVPIYAKVHYRDIYPGIDLIYDGSQHQLEYDFIVSPGADPDTISLGFQGGHSLEVNTQGDLVLHTAAGALHQRKPFIYQEVDGVRREIPGRYALKDAYRVGFQVAAYDASRPLIIDPVLVYSTYLGGTGGEAGSGIAVDTAGNAYVTGMSFSTNFPTTAGVFQTAAPSEGNVFVTKLNPTGSGLVYSTYLGGSGNDGGKGIAVDPAGNVYVTGFTASSNFPTTPGAFQTAFGGGSNAFVAKLNPSGSELIYSTYLGGIGLNAAEALAVDAAGNAYVTGLTASSNFPTTPGAFETTYPAGGVHAFVTKVNPKGSGLVYSTYLGGRAANGEVGRGIALDIAGNAYIAGQTDSTTFPTTPGAFQTTYGGGRYDAFLTKVNPAGSGLVYSTYLGGNADDGGKGIAVDPAGNVYVTGFTASSNFPTTPGAFQTTYGGGVRDTFVAKVNPAGSGLVYSTYLGGSGNDGGTAASIAVDAAGNAYVTGATDSPNFPASNAVQGVIGGGSDAFVTKVNPAGSGLIYSTYLGGIGFDGGEAIAVDAAGNAYVTGRTSSTNLPTTPGAFRSTFGGGLFDAFVAKIAMGSGTGN